jgi:hypothetical protein
MRHFVVSFFLLVTYLAGHAQFNYLDTVYKLNKYTSEISYGSVKLSNDKFVISGYSTTGINLFCINAKGDTLWNQQYSTDTLGEPGVVRAVLDANKNILVAGYVSIPNSQEVRAIFLKADSFGNLIWLHGYRSDSSNFSEYIGIYGYIPVVTFNNQYLLMCQNGRGPDVANMQAIITDTSGNEIARWRYVNPFYEWPKFAIQTSDSGFLFGGFSDRLDPDTLPYFWTMYVKKVDQYGTLLWDTSIEALSTGGYIYTGDASAQDAIEVSDGYVIAGERSDSSNFTYPNNNRGWDKCWYGKFSKPDGHLQWEHYLGYDSLLEFAVFYGISQTEDGGFAVCGIQNYQNNTHNHGFVVKTDANGDTLWSYTITRHIDSIHYTEQMELHGIYEIDGGYLSVGWRVPNWPLDENEFPYVLTIDTNGCPMYNCRSAIDTADSVIIDNTALLLYPNPNNGLLFINMQVKSPNCDYALHIYDVRGRLLLIQEHLISNQLYPVNVNRFANGMYFVEVLNGNNVVGRGRFVKE